MGLIAETRQGAVLIWTLDREARLNALPDLGDGDEFAEACARANADMTVKCVVLTGAGRAFSAGGDLTAMRDRRDLFEGSGAEIRTRYRRVVHRIVRSLYDLEIPLVSAVNGPAMGLGCGIAATAAPFPHDLACAAAERMLHRDSLRACAAVLVRLLGL